MQCTLTKFTKLLYKSSYNLNDSMQYYLPSSSALFYSIHDPSKSYFCLFLHVILYYLVLKYPKVPML